MRIYLDTNLWNVSLDQGIDPVAVVEGLDKHGSTLVLGQHAFFELLKTFEATTSDPRKRGMDLFAHLRSYLGAGLRCVAKDPYECVAAEMYALRGPRGAEKFLSNEDVLKFAAECEELANGLVRQEWVSHITNLKLAARADRKGQQEFCENNPLQTARLKSVEASELASWMDRELGGPLGNISLTRQLKLRFPEVADGELREYATVLLNARSRVACSMVRSELYFNWRCAERGSCSADLLDDMYHVINAAYCDIYATEESKQTQYASLLLPATTQTLVYDKTIRLDTWLLKIAKRYRR